MSASTILRRPAFWVCAALGLLASCIDDFADSSARPGFSEGEREVIIKLEVPQQVMPPAPDGGSTTRTVETPEINDLYILAFQATGTYLNNVAQEPYLYYVKAEKGSGGKWTANLKAANYQQTFVMLANTKSTATETGGHTYDLTAKLKKALESANGKNKTEVLKDLYVSLEGEIDPDGELPLCGQMAGQTIEKPATPDAATPEISVTLQRMVARLNLYIKADGSGMDKFKLTRIYVYNPRQKGMVASAQLSAIGAAAITLPTLPLAEGDKYEAPGARLEYDLEDGATSFTNEIYLFENGQPDQYPIVGTDQNTDLGLYRPCLIIGGTYDGGSEKFWRVDFIDDATKAPMNILRNYTYNVTLTAVEENTGNTDPDEALKTGRSTISASIVAWNDSNLGGVSFGENNFLGLGKVAYQYGQGGTSYGTQTVMATSELAWTAHLVTDKEADPENAQVPGWIKFMQTAENGGESLFVDKLTGTGQGLNTPETLNFYVEEYYDEAPRTAYMVFTAGNLEKLTCTITQTNERLLEIVVTGEELMQFTDNGKLFRKLTVAVAPTNDTKLSWYYSKGTFGDIQGNVTGEKTFNMTNTLTFGDPIDGTDVTVPALSAGQSPKGFLYLTLTDLKEPTKTVTKAIPMEQLEFWLKFQTPKVIVPADGSKMSINVESNFKWKCVGYCTPELAEQNGLNKPGSQRKWATPETIAGYESLVNAFTGEQNGDPNGNSIFNITPKTFNTTNVSELEKIARMDFLFTDETGNAIIKSDSLLIWRALHAPSGNLYEVGKTDKEMTHNEYAYKNVIEGQKVMNMRDGDWADNPLGKWFTTSPALARIISSLYPSETHWFTGDFFGNYKQEDVSDGQYKNAMFAATITGGDQITPIPMLLIAKNPDHSSSKNFVMVNSVNPFGVNRLSYSIHKYTAQGEDHKPGSVGQSYKSINNYPLVLYSDNFNEEVGEWTYHSDYGDNTPYDVWTETRLTYEEPFPLYDADGSIISGKEMTDDYVPYKFTFSDNAFKIKHHGYYVKLLVKKKDIYEDLKD